jgi:hypothetical protein
MFTQNKWYNLGIFVLVALVVCLIVQHTTKVVDKDGKEIGSLKTFSKSSDTSTLATK